jgi:hypothetical protein
MISTNPLKLVRGDLPRLEDKDPAERATWIYTWDEIAKLVHDTKLPADRRVLNALRFGTGERISEIAVLRVRDWDRTAKPLTCINVGRARKSVSRREGGTKTGAIKPCPLVPVVATMLADWIDRGWEEHFGRKPKSDDFIVPTRMFHPRHENNSNRQFKGDCERVGVRVLSQHKARHAFISLAQRDGGDPQVLRWITHAPPRSAFDGYSRAPWERLCQEISKLRFPHNAENIAEVLANSPYVIADIARGSNPLAPTTKPSDSTGLGLGQETEKPPSDPISQRSSFIETPAGVARACESALWRWHDLALAGEVLS